MKTIHKYGLTWIDGDVLMPEGAKILSVKIVNAKIYLWAMVDTDKPLVPRRILRRGTGWDLEEGEGLGQFIGTVIGPDGLVWHIFEAVE